MQESHTATITMDRLRWLAYGIAGGLIAGVFIGWIFHAIVALIIKLFLLIVVIVCLIAAVRFWQRISGERKRTKTDSVVSDADWREVNSQGRNSGR